MMLVLAIRLVAVVAMAVAVLLAMLGFACKALVVEPPVVLAAGPPEDTAALLPAPATAPAPKGICAQPSSSALAKHSPKPAPRTLRPSGAAIAVLAVLGQAFATNVISSLQNKGL